MNETIQLKKRFFPSGEIEREAYCLDQNENNLHREDGPAIIYYYESGKIHIQSYFSYGLRHRKNEPAFIKYYKTGEIEEESYFENNQLHRFDGPAATVYCRNGETYSRSYYINGTHLSNFTVYGKNKIFEYIKDFPEYIKEIELMARYNHWLNEEQILLLNTVSAFMPKKNKTS